jgi:methylated-DNA-[protein]-cysteine S-methyltransferase
LRYVKYMDKRSLKRMVADHAGENPRATWEHSVTDLRPIADQFDEYFSGTRTHIRVPLDPVGSEFQMQVWRALLDIPFGQTRTYGEVARAIGQPNSARAVGLANNQNPLAIVVPCHRVIGADGKLVGYSGGVARKKHLLTLEAHFGKLDPVDMNRVIASAKVRVEREPDAARTVKRPARSTSKPTPRTKPKASRTGSTRKVAAAAPVRRERRST